jgi:ribose transport system substrate-binding protein
MIGLTIVTAGVAVALAGCGGGGGGKEAGGKANVEAAKKLAEAGRAEVMSRSLNVAGASWKGPQSSPPVLKGKTVAVMPCSLALEVCRFIGKQFQEGATAIGWKSFLIDGRSDPATEQKAVDAAINKGVDCIVTFAAVGRDIKPQIKRANSKDIPVIVAFADDPKPFGGTAKIGLDYGNAGRVLAAYVIEQGGGDILVTNIPQLTELTLRTNGFVDYIKKNGGDKAKIVDREDFTIADIGPGQEAKMRALLQRNPNAKWVYGPFDGAIYALLDTAKQQGHPLKGVSFDGDPPAYADIRNGADEGRGQLATISWALDWVAWATVDECNRAMQDQPVEVNKDFSIELTDETNVPSKDVNVYEPGFDFRTKFKELWGVK